MLSQFLKQHDMFFPLVSAAFSEFRRDTFKASLAKVQLQRLLDFSLSLFFSVKALACF